MNRMISWLLAGLFVAMCAEAAQRTFVSAGSGSDADPCTRQQPCRNFAAAMAQTESGGEVVVLDSGGYGVASITQSVSLISPAGVYAGITAFSGDAVTVNVDNAVIVLRGLSLNGLGGTHGINFTGQTTSASNSRLFVESCVISGFSNGRGLNFARNGTLLVRDLIARENSIGILVAGSPTLPSQASIDHALLERNFISGLEVRNAAVAIRDSVAAGNLYGFLALPNVSEIADLSADKCQATHNDRGFQAQGTAGSTLRLMVSNSVAYSNRLDGIFATCNSTVWASGNIVSRNGTGLRQNCSGVFRSAGNNTVDGNTSETSGTITTFGPQ